MACASILFIVPESPIWLVEKGLYDMADRAIDTLGRDQLEFAEEVQFMKTIDRVNECLKIIEDFFSVKYIHWDSFQFY